MGSYDDKIIPTLDDIIKPGDLDKAVLSNLRSFDDTSDELDDDSIKLFTDATEELDDTFDNEFEKLYADADADSYSDSDPDGDTETDHSTARIEQDDALPNVADEAPADETIDIFALDTGTLDASDAATVGDLDISMDEGLDSDLSRLEEAPGYYDVARQMNDTRAASISIETDDSDASITDDMEEYDNDSDDHDELADMIVAESFSGNDAAMHTSRRDADDDIDLPEKPRAYDVAAWGAPVVKFEELPDSDLQDGVLDDVPSADTAPEIEHVIEHEFEADTESEMAYAAAEDRFDARVESATKTADATTTDSDAPATQATEVSLAMAAGVAAGINVGELVDDITKKLMPEIEWKIRMRLREVLDEIFPEE